MENYGRVATSSLSATSNLNTGKAIAQYNADSIAILEAVDELISAPIGDVPDRGGIQAVKPTRIKMAWRDNKNKEDCGVYVMRHMDTFMGSLAKDCDCGLVKGNRSQLDRLRVKYAAAIPSAQINEF
nr:zinc finger BED domain-containing protein RICESLEEPER 2-like [Ipomoea batatas]